MTAEQLLDLVMAGLAGVGTGHLLGELIGWCRVRRRQRGSGGSDHG